MLPLDMVPIREIKPENIRGVVYIDTGTPGRVNGVKLILEDSTTHTYHGEDVAPALALAKQRFRPEPEESRMADQPVKDCRLDPGDGSGSARGLDCRTAI